MSGRWKTRKNNVNKGLSQGAAVRVNVRAPTAEEIKFHTDTTRLNIPQQAAVGLSLRVPTEEEVRLHTNIFENRLQGYINDADREVLQEQQMNMERQRINRETQNREALMRRMLNKFVEEYRMIFGYDRKSKEQIEAEYDVLNNEVQRYIEAENERYPFQSKVIKFNNWTYKMKERNPNMPKEELYMENPQFKYAWEMFLSEEKAKQEENVRKHNEMLSALRQAEEARDEESIRELRKKLFENSSSWFPSILGKGGRKYYKIRQTTPRRYKSRRANGTTPRKNKRKRGSKRR